jgi:hypothetical protein
MKMFLCWLSCEDERLRKGYDIDRADRHQSDQSLTLNLSFLFFVFFGGGEGFES